MLFFGQLRLLGDGVFVTFPAGWKRKVFSALVLVGICLLCAQCGMHRYSNTELLKKTFATYPPQYGDIIRPLDSSLVPIRKQLFFLKNEVAELKDKLWDAGTNQRIMKIDDRIDSLHKEISSLSVLHKEMVNVIIRIYPAYKEPAIVAYTGNGNTYKKTDGPIILITQQDKADYLRCRDMAEKMSQSVEYRNLIVFAMKQYYELPDSLKPALQVVGAQLPPRRY